MPRLIRRRSLSGLAAAATLARPAITRAAANELRVRRASDFQTFDPAFVSTLEDEVVTASILAPLVSYYRSSDKAPWKTRPWLADKVDPANGAVQFDVALRDAENWKVVSTSQGVLADDIRFSFMRLRDNTLLPNHYIMNGLRGVSVTDGQKAQINLTAADTEFPVTVLGRGQAAVLPKSALESTADKNFGLNPPDQSGAYTIKELVQGDRLVLERNTNWKGRAAKYDRVIFHVIPDEPTAKVAADRGDIDVMQVSRDLLMQRALPVSSTQRPVIAPTGLMVYLTIFPAADAMNSADVRRGVQLALDPAEAVRSAYREIGAIAATGFLPTGWPERPFEPPFKPDRDTARTLLSKLAGRSPLRLAVVPGFLSNVAEWIGATLNQLDIKVEAVMLDPPRWRQYADHKGEFDLLLTFAPLWRIGLQQTLARFSTLHPIYDPQIDELNAEAAKSPTPEVLRSISARLNALGAVHVLAEENYGWIVRQGIDFAVRPDGFMDQPGNWRD
jgi:ABC-type transport system substrate-binding protein